MTTETRFEFYDPFAEALYRFPTFRQAAAVATEMGGSTVVELEDDRAVRRWRLESGGWQAERMRPGREALMRHGRSSGAVRFAPSGGRPLASRSASPPSAASPSPPRG